jgi:hypothetical protein
VHPEDRERALEQNARIYSVARDVTASKHAENEREQLVREILSICSYCRKIRDDEDFWSVCLS